MLIRTGSLREVIRGEGRQGKSVEDAFYRSRDGEEITGAIRHCRAVAITAFLRHEERDDVEMEEAGFSAGKEQARVEIGAAAAAELRDKLRERQAE